MATTKQYNPVAVPIRDVAPIFVNAVTIALPAEYAGGALTNDIWSVFGSMQSITIRQHVKLLPKRCCSCPPCVKKENTYSVYAGMTQNDEKEILRIDEVSDDWNRCCCQPYHPLKMEVRQFVPVDGAGSNTTEWQHMMQDFNKDIAGLGGVKKQEAIDAWYKSQPVLLTMLRDDGQRCCYKCPCKLYSTFVCCNFCQDGMHVYAGDLQDNPEGEKGRPFNPDPSKLIGSVIQPQYGGWFTPTLHLRDAGSENPFAKVEGPCFFGGWSEMCCNFQYFISRFGSEKKSGDLGLIVKKKPANVAGAFKELISDADVYSVSFKDEANLTASQKVTMLTAQILADYMWFEGSTEKCKSDDSGITCYCCFFSCIGALCPVYIYCPKSS